jgi:hypothetical protein
MTTAKIVRAEATEAFNLDQNSNEPKYKDITDVIPHYCFNHKHPLIDGVGLCLCNMLCSTKEEVIMAAVLFLNSETDSEPFVMDTESVVVFVPDDAVSDIETFGQVNEIIETYSDSGAVKVSFSDLVNAYNKVHKTKLRL